MVERVEIMPSAVYRAVPGSNLDDRQAAQLGPLLHGLTLSLPPERLHGMVVKAARPANSPMHDWFEWDDSIAGEKYRRLQAGQLLRSVIVEVQEKPPSRLDGSSVVVPQPVVVRRQREVVAQGVGQSQPLDPVARAHRELLAWRERWGAIASPAFERFRGVLMAIDALRGTSAVDGSQRRCVECRGALDDSWPKVRCEDCQIRPVVAQRG